MTKLEAYRLLKREQEQVQFELEELFSIMTEEEQNIAVSENSYRK